MEKQTQTRVLMTHKYTNLCHSVQMRDGLFYAKHARSLTITLKRASKGQTADTDLEINKERETE